MASTRGFSGIFVSLIVLVAGLLLLEFASRLLVPIAPGVQFYNEAGVSAEIKDGGLRLLPNITFRQVSPDFDAVGHTGPDGYRAPLASTAPDIVFLGDSFTFGQGLTDDETFAAIACRAWSAQCANLGHPGTGAVRQVASLSQYLVRKSWKPREVLMFVFAMSSSFAAGNDFFDTLDELEHDVLAAETPGAPANAQPSPATSHPMGLGERLLEMRKSVLAHSNLARIAYAYFGPSLRSMFSFSDTAQLEAGIAALSGQLELLRQLSDRHGFTYTIYVLHPVQDLLRGTYEDTAAAVRRAAPDAHVVETASALLDNPRAYYFPYDGHLNAAGARRIAEFLINERRQRESPRP